MNWEAFALTARLAVIVAAVLVVIGLPIAYWITFSRWRWKFLIEAVVSVPLVLPPTVLGYYLLVLFGNSSWVGRWYEPVTGHTLAFTFTGLVIGSILYSLPFAVQPFAASFAGVDARLLAASVRRTGRPRARAGGSRGRCVGGRCCNACAIARSAPAPPRGC